MSGHIEVTWAEAPTADGAAGLIATVWVDHRARLNVVGPDLLDALSAAIAEAGRRPGLRVLVLRGAGGRAFIGGADINVMAGLTAATAAPFIRRIHACCDALRSLDVPTVAVIEGWALGAGLEIAAACDLRIARDDSRFGMPEVRVGIPSVVEAALLPHLIGWGRTRWLVLTGDVIGTEEAAAWGLVEAVATAEALPAALDRLLASLCAGAPGALGLQKRLVRAWEDLPTGQAIEAGVAAFAKAFEGDEPATYMAAFHAAQAARKAARKG